MFSCFAIKAKSQSTVYDLIKLSIENKMFNKEFFICKNSNTIKIFDKIGVIDTDFYHTFCNKTIEIKNDSRYRNLIPDSPQARKIDGSVILLYCYEKNNNEYTLCFWRPYSGASLKLTFEKKRRKYKFTKHIIGTF